MSPPICARSGKRTATSSSSLAGTFGNAAAIAAHAAQHAPETEARRRVLDFAQSTKLSLGLLIAASAANAGLGFVAAITKSTCSNAAAIASYARTRSVFGDGGGAQVVERLRQIQADRDLVGEIGRARRPAVAELREQRRRGCPPSTARRGSAARAERRPRPCRFAAMSAAADARTRSSTAGSTVTPPRSGTTATRRPARSCVPSAASQPAMLREARRVERVVAAAHVVVPRRVANRAGQAAEHDRARAEPRVGPARDPAVRALHAEQPGVAGRDANRSRRRRRRSRASRGRRRPRPRCRPTNHRAFGRGATDCG